MANGGLAKLKLETEIVGDKDVITGLENVSVAVDRSATATKTATQRMAADMDRTAAASAGLTTVIRSMASAIAATASAMASWKMTEYIQDAARYAARVVTLGVAMTVAGNNAGYTAMQTSAYEKQIKTMGITTEASREAIVKMSASQMDLSKSSQLARIAQDAAVVGNINSSEAFSRMIQGIRSGEVEILRNIGISVQFEAGYKATAATLGKTTDALTEQEKTQSRVNQVLAEGSKMQGIYEAAMGTTGKQLTSITRYTDELKLSFGEAFAPALGVLVEETTDKLKALLKHFEDNRGAYKEFAGDLAGIVRAVAHPIDTIQKFAYSPFEGTAVEERSGIEAQNRLNTEAANKTLAEAKERQRIRLAQEAQAAARQEAARTAAEKAAEAEIGNYNQFVEKYNAIISKMEESDPTLTKYAQSWQKIANEQAAHTLQHPKQAADFEEVYNWVRKETEARQERLDILEREGRDDNADNWAKMYGAAAKSMEAFYKEESARSRLSIENQLAAIDTQEKFFQLSAGEAAEKRISLLQQALDLENESYENAAEDSLLREELLRTITTTNAKLLEQQRILADQGAVGAAESALREYSRAAADVGSQTKGVVTDFLKGMEDALVKFVRHGKLEFRSLVDSMLDDIARMTVKQSITGPLSNWLAGLINGSGSNSSSGGGLGSLLSSFSSGNSGSGYLSGIVSLLGGGASSAAVGAGSYGVLASDAGYTWAAPAFGETAAASGSSAASSAGSGAMGAGYGPYIAGAIYTYQWMSDYFGSGGAWNKKTDDQKAAVQWGNNVSAGGAMWLDSLTGGGLFGSGWQNKSGGLAMQIVDGVLSSQQYTEQSRKKSWWRGSESRYLYDDLNPLFEDFLSSRFNGLMGGITGALGGDLGKLKNLNVAQQSISLSGKSDSEIQTAIDKYFADMVNVAIKAVYPELDKFAKHGEDAAATLNRVYNNLKTVNQVLNILGVASYDFSVQGVKSADALINAFGGLEKAGQAIEKYYSSGLFSDIEQQQFKLQIAQSTIAETFGRLGLDVPKTNEEFRNLVKQQLSLGESGATAAAALMQVAPIFSTVTSAVQEMATKTSESSKKIIEAAKKTLTDSLSTAADLLGTLKAMLTGPLAALSPEEAYRQAKALFATADATNAGARGTSLLEASRSYNASGVAYQTDYAAVTSRLAQLAETAPTLSDVDRQINLLTEIRTAIEKGDAQQLAALQVTFDAAQITMGLAGNSLSAALTGIQSVLNTPITAGTASPALTGQISALQSAIDTSITSGTASPALAGQIATLQATLNNNGQPLTGTAATAINVALAAIQAAMNGVISPQIAQTTIGSAYATIQAAMNGTISSTVASTGISNQYALLQQAINKTITGSAAVTGLNTTYGIVQAALNGTISAADAEAAIKREYDSITGALTTGVSGALTSVSTALADFNRTMAASVTETQKGLQNFVVALEVMQAYPIQKAAFDTQLQALNSGPTTNYAAQAAALYAPVKATYDRGVAAGLTTLTAPVDPTSTAYSDERMKRLASQYAQTASEMSVGAKPYDKRYDLYPDGRIDYNDVWLWQWFASSTLPWSVAFAGLPAFAGGTSGLDADGPVYAHKYEKIIDPVSSQILSRYGIKISSEGSTDNRALAEEVKQLRAELKALLSAGLKLDQAGYAEIVEQLKQGNKDLKTAASGTTLAKRAA